MQNPKVLKRATRSFCPSCLKTISARVLASEEGVFIEHNCRLHGTIKVQIERDVGFFQTLMDLSPEQKIFSPYLTVFPTYRCNLNCRVCYVPRRDPAMDMKMEEIGEILDGWPHPDVFYAGGEPTALENLPDIIALTRSKGKRPYIVTNGVKLADLSYLGELVKSGLQGLSFSLNGLDGKILEAVDGENYLEAKMQALSNLKRKMRRFAICFSLVPGINDRELGRVLRFTVRQYPFARSFHSECLPDIGRGATSRRLFLSEMMDLLAKELGLTREDLLKSASTGRALIGPYGYTADYRDISAPSLRRDGMVSFAAIALTKLANSNRPDFRVRIISGPLPDNVDLEETWSATTTMAISRESSMMPLWEYLIRFHGKDYEKA